MEADQGSNPDLSIQTTSALKITPVHSLSESTLSCQEYNPMQGLILMHHKILRSNIKRDVWK